ncbi:hypothetical protein Enr13x_41160 [Stieleria neptunia]|uniref:Uncharacterized protein n=1 Tax=Stieleria neptunia TaxID=2527979 RepID=A0A518HTT1_9BACT|nr:hypothetical protein Enr13x_41160 [Stieleria neptunia]
MTVMLLSRCNPITPDCSFLKSKPQHLDLLFGIVSVPAGLIASALGKAREIEE